MAIEIKESLLHWNYFLALENDFLKVSRYIEFAEPNFSTYSIELAHLLLASSSEVDVVLKQLCTELDNTSSVSNINEYRDLITRELAEFSIEEVFIPRYATTLKPWSNWNRNANPDWWRSYNNVKHQRNTYFQEANLRNALNAMAGLLVSIFYYYKVKFTKLDAVFKQPKEVNDRLKPELQFFQFRDSYYFSHLVV